MSTLDEILDDLAVEGDLLRATVAGLDAGGWRTPTPALGWDVATQIAHLSWTDETSLTAARASATEAGKQAWDAVVLDALADPEHFVDRAAGQGAQAAPADLLARWDAARPALAEALRRVPAGERLPWFGPPMAPASMATARFMETWAHGLDVYEALGMAATPSERIKHVCHLGARTRDFAYAARAQEPPAEPFRIELTSPAGAVWVWGPDAGDGVQQITGSAWDFACLVTQRLHRDDTGLVAVGDDAAAWLAIAQAFAGPPGAGREKKGPA